MAQQAVESQKSLDITNFTNNLTVIQNSLNGTPGTSSTTVTTPETVCNAAGDKVIVCDGSADSLTDCNAASTTTSTGLTDVAADLGLTA